MSRLSWTPNSYIQLSIQHFHMITNPLVQNWALGIHPLPQKKIISQLLHLNWWQLPFAQSKGLRLSWILSFSQTLYPISGNTVGSTLKYIHSLTSSHYPHCTTLAQATIISQLNYCCSILPSLPTSILAKHAKSCYFSAQNTSLASYRTKSKSQSPYNGLTRPIHGPRLVTTPITSPVMLPFSPSCLTILALLLKHAT